MRKHPIRKFLGLNPLFLGILVHLRCRLPRQKRTTIRQSSRINSKYGSMAFHSLRMKLILRLSHSHLTRQANTISCSTHGASLLLFRHSSLSPTEVPSPSL